MNSDYRSELNDNDLTVAFIQCGVQVAPPYPLSHWEESVGGTFPGNDTYRDFVNCF